MLSFSLLFEFFRAFFALMEVLLLRHDMQRNLNKKKTRLKMVWKNLPINVERWKSARMWKTVHNSWAISFPVTKFTTFGIQIFRLTSHNWKMEEHGLMLQLKSSLLIALASARCQPWGRTTDLITIVSGQLWNEIEVTHPSHNEVTQPLRNLPHVHKGWVN